jgi:putative pyruvate formate lyase activating enzyme
MEREYLTLHKTGRLKEIINELYKILEECSLCPRECKVNRLKGEKGYCRSGKLPIVSSIGPHFGEEPPLVGYFGSGTIFFTNCNLSCVYCQNYSISQLKEGEEISIEKLAEYMLYLQKIGTHNVNFVTPTHFVPQIVSALEIAINDGFNLPLVYNSSGYDSLNVIKLCKGIFDIYMPDFKYGNDENALKYSNAPNYTKIAREVIKEMYNQVGNLKVNDSGIATSGLIIRHLVLPNNIADSFKVIKFILEEISESVYLNIMDQYRPTYKAYNYPELNRNITRKEFEEVIDAFNKGKIRRKRRKILSTLCNEKY